MAFPGDPLNVRVEIQIEDSWTDITPDVYTREDITITRGRADEGTEVDPGKCTFVLNNRDGKYSPRNPRSPYYKRIGRNTPVRVSVVHEGDTIPRFTGEITAWPPRWDLSGQDVYVPVEASGILRRLNASVAPLESALRRWIVAQSPAAYWPLTDGENTQNAASVVGGNIAYLNVREGDRGEGMQWANVELASWMEPIAETPKDATRGVFRGYILPGHRPADWWSVEFVRSGRGGQDSMSVQLEGAGTDADPTRFWYLGFDGRDGVQVPRALFVTYSEVGDTTSSLDYVQSEFEYPDAFEEDEAHVFRLEVREYEGECAWRIVVDGETLREGTHGVPYHPPIRWLYNFWTPDDDATTVGLGHVTVWDGPVDPENVMLAYHGHSHETAGERIARVCEEAGIACAFVGDPGNTQRVGPQELATPLEVLNSAANTDGGILYEDREAARLVYRTNRSRYNWGRLLATEE